MCRRFNSVPDHHFFPIILGSSQFVVVSSSVSSHLCFFYGCPLCITKREEPKVRPEAWYKVRRSPTPDTTTALIVRRKLVIEARIKLPIG